MAFKFILFACFVAAVSARLSHQTGQHDLSAFHSKPHYVVKETDHPTNYKPIYANPDEEIRRHHEIRRSDKIHGQYSLVDPDGKLRLVNYHADRHPQFSATAHRRPTEAKIVQPLHRFYTRPVQTSNLHTVAVAESPISHRQHAAPLEARNPRHHTIPALHSTQNDAPVSYITFSQVLPASYYGHKNVHTTSYASQHPY